MVQSSETPLVISRMNLQGNGDHILEHVTKGVYHSNLHLSFTTHCIDLNVFSANVSLAILVQRCPNISLDNDILTLFCHVTTSVILKHN